MGYVGSHPGSSWGVIVGYNRKIDIIDNPNINPLELYLLTVVLGNRSDTSTLES